MRGGGSFESPGRPERKLDVKVISLIALSDDLVDESGMDKPLRVNPGVGLSTLNSKYLFPHFVRFH